MTQDFVLISDSSKMAFTRDLLKAVKNLESKGFICEIKFSTAEGTGSYNTVFSALIQAYKE